MKKIIIGVDHGFGMVKTSSSCFEAGVKEFTSEPPILKRVVEYQGKFYALGGKRQNVQPNKTADDHYYIMTLGAMAEELRKKGMNEAEVVLAAGLPLTRFGAEKKDFARYLSKIYDITYKYEGQPYHVYIKDVDLSPQGYASIIDRVGELCGLHVVVDIGSWTVDVLPLNDGIPDMTACASLNMGVITCFNETNEELRRVCGSDVSEKQIQDMMCGKDIKLPAEYKEIIKRSITDYAHSVIDKLREMGVRIETTPLIITGGGACVIKNFYAYDKDMTTVVDDIYANAKGFEQIAAQRHPDINNV